jgi:primosomal protein N''
VCKTEHLLSKLEGLKRELDKQQRRTNSSKPKRHRRTAEEIARDYPCSYCGKAYGSEGALLQHISLKHKASGEKQEDSSST